MARGRFVGHIGIPNRERSALPAGDNLTRIGDSYGMRQYHDLMEMVLRSGVEKRDRTGTGTLSIFGHQMRFDLADGFPMVTTKKLFLKAIVYELLWFLKGDTNVRYLRDNKVTIGTNGPTRMANWGLSADTSGVHGPMAMAAPSTRSPI
jgi:hypothetical protein